LLVPPEIFTPAIDGGKFVMVNPEALGTDHNVLFLTETFQLPHCFPVRSREQLITVALFHTADPEIFPCPLIFRTTVFASLGKSFPVTITLFRIPVFKPVGGLIPVTLNSAVTGITSNNRILTIITAFVNFVFVTLIT